MKTSSSRWASYYQGLKDPKNFYPENFVARIFLSKHPVQFLDHDYKDKKILDLGCGHGRHIPFLKNLGFKVEGLEVSQEQTNSLQKNFPDDKFLCGRSASIPEKDESYDYILACNSIYYLDGLDDFPKHISECARVLKRNGFLIFSMLGAQHSLLKNAQKHEDCTALNKDFLDFRQGTLVRPLWNIDDLPTICLPLTLIKYGEIIENCDGFIRHIYYIVARK